MAAEYTDEDLLARWEEFFETADYRSRVIEVSDHYPEMRSVSVSYSDLDQFDPDMADFLLQHPNRVLWNGEQTIKKLIPPSREGAEIHLRIVELPRDSRVEIRKLRSKHLGKFISVEGLVRKATEVRPKITAAYFQCMRCHAILKEPQEGMFFKEPLECYKEQDGCGRSASTTKFKLLTEESRYVDTQKIEIQESPEGLRGGAQPERLVGYLEDDIAGKIFPGYRVILNGILHSVQKGPVAKSTLFDINLDIVSVEFQEHEYEEISIEEEDKEEIAEAVRKLAKAIREEFDEEELVFVCVLKGSFMFTSDLVRQFAGPVVVDFIRVSSYGNGMTTQGTARVTKDLETDIGGRNVVIVEDVIDSGLTLTSLRDMLLARGPRRLRICALVDKRARRQVEIEGDYVGFTMEDGFIVGYGIDYAEKYRNLPEIFVVEKT